MNENIAAKRYPEGLPGLLSMKEFCILMDVSRPTGLSIVRQYPEYTLKRGNTQMVAIGLYQKLTHDESTKLANGVSEEPVSKTPEAVR